MDFIPYDIFKDLMLDLVGKYSGPPIAPTDVQDLQSTIPPSLSLGHLSRAGQADPQPQSDKTSSSDNKQHALDNFSSIKGSDTKGGDTTSGSPNERGKEAPKSQTFPSSLDSTKNFILPGHPDSWKSVSPANSNKQPSKSFSVSSSLDIQKDTYSDKYTAHGHSVSTIKTKGYAADSHSRLKDGDHKKDSSSSGHSDHRQTFCSTRSKSAAFSSRLETRDIRVSRSDEHANHSSEKSHGSAEIIKTEEKLNTEVAATPQTKDDSHSPRMKDKLNEQEPSHTVEENTKNSVEKLARFVVEMGLGMDAFHAEKLANNPHFSFLKAGRTAAYEFLKEKLFEFRKSFGSSAQIKQQDSKSKEPIPESPQAVQKSSDSATTPQTDCFTPPMLPPLRKRKVTPDAPAVPLKKISQDETLKVDAKTRDAAEKLARFVVRMGPEMERFTKAEAANPQFWFLNQKDHPAYEFYQMKLAEFSKVKQAGELSSAKPPAQSKSSSESQSPTDPAAEPRSALLLLSEIYDSDEEDSQSKDGASQNGSRQRKSRTKRTSSNTKRTSTKHDPRVGIRSKVSEWQKYLRSADELANQSVRVIILARKIGAVKKRLARDIAASKKKRMPRTTIGTQTEPEVPVAKEVPVSIKRSLPKQMPPAKVKKLKNPTGATPVKPESSLPQKFSDVDARTKETAENLARFIVEVGPSIGGGLDLNVLSKNPEFWFLNDKCSSAYTFFQKKHTEFCHKWRPDPVKADNLGKVALQDFKSQTSKHPDPTPPDVKPLVSQDTDPDCFIVEPEEPAPQRSNPTPPAPQRSNPTPPGPQRSNPTPPAPQRSNPTPPAPQRSNPTPPAPQRSNPTPPAPQRPNPTPHAPKRPNPTPPAPKRPNPTPPAPKRPNPTPPAPQRSNLTPTAPQRSNPTPPAPQRSNPTPPAPQRSNPTPPAPQRSNPTPPAPKRSNPTPPAPQGSNPTPPAPQGSNLTPPAPQGSNPTPPAPPSSKPVELLPQPAEPVQPAQQPLEAVQEVPQSSEPPEPEPDYSIMVSCCSDDEDSENP